jgi:hypoxanthine phosphoribosyltransferase
MIPPVDGSRLVVPRAEIDAAFGRLAAATQPLVAAGQCVLLGVLLGGLVPLARLAGLLSGDFLLDTCRVGRYGAAMRGGTLRLVVPPRLDLSDQHVVIVDDIFDEGVTLDFLARYCREAGARRVTTVVLVRKRHARAVTGQEPDILGVEVGDEYVFGCGMDYRGHWRHLPEIWGVPAA